MAALKKWSHHSLGKQGAGSALLHPCHEGQGSSPEIWCLVRGRATQNNAPTSAWPQAVAQVMQNPSARILMETQASDINKDPSYVRTMDPDTAPWSQMSPWPQVSGDTMGHSYQYGPRWPHKVSGSSPDHRYPHVVTQAADITCSRAIDPDVALGSRT